MYTIIHANTFRSISRPFPTLHLQVHPISQENLRNSLFQANFHLFGVREQQAFSIQYSGDFSSEVEVVFGTTADEGLLYLLDALKDETALEIWR